MSAIVFVFETALAGLALLALVRVVECFIPVVVSLENGAVAWAPFKHAGTLATLAVIALAIPPLVNRKIPEDEAAARRALVEESRFGWLLRESLEQGYPVEISTTTRKSYVGFVLDEDPQGWERDVAILPVLSGYRDPRNLRLRITANYADLLSDEMAENYAVAIAMKEIVSIARFDRSVHEKQVKESGGAE